MTHILGHNCATCSFWTGDKKKGVGEGQCHRYPKVAAGVVPTQNPLTRQVQPMALFAWPQLSATEWCGEWQPDLTS